MGDMGSSPHTQAGSKPMSDTKNNNSFSHAFLPGLILGLIIGAVAGAFLPDLLSAPKIPVATGNAGGSGASQAQDRQAESGDDAELQEALEEAKRQLEEGTEQVEDAAEDILNNLPVDPPADD